MMDLNTKIQYLGNLLAPFLPPDLSVFASNQTGYRMRAEFRIWHDGANISYAMFEKDPTNATYRVVKLTQLSIAHDSINALMPRLLAYLSDKPILRNHLYQCEFLATLSGEMLLTLIYHKKLDEAWLQSAQVLQHDLGIKVIGRSRGQKLVLSQDYVTERLQVHNQIFEYRQLEGGFTQPNAKMCEQMLQWACEQAKYDPSRDLLELYCGNGNFTLPLSLYFHRVLATEVSKTSVLAALHNAKINHCDNITIARLSAQEFTQAYPQERDFRRLVQQNISLHDYHFSTIFIDPPRAGVDEETLKLVAQFERIIYISCNPHTLCDNLRILCQSHHIAAAALFDQFPQTPHIESGVLLIRNKEIR